MINQVITDVKEIQILVSTAIENGADSVEKVHQAIAKLPLDYLEKFGKLETTTKDVKEFQEKSIGQVYDLIRAVNDKASDIAGKMLDRASTK